MTSEKTDGPMNRAERRRRAREQQRQADRRPQTREAIRANRPGANVVNPRSGLVHSTWYGHPVFTGPSGWATDCGLGLPEAAPATADPVTCKHCLREKAREPQRAALRSLLTTTAGTA